MAPCAALVASLLAGLCIPFCLTGAAAADERSLFEMSKENRNEPGLDPFLEANMEPLGAICVAYVKQDSANHKLVKELAAVTTVSDEELWDLHLPIGGAIDWEAEERLEIRMRDIFKPLWSRVNKTGLDQEPVIFPSKPGKTWQRKQVRTWMLEHAYPTINYRVPTKQGDIGDFPFNKYFRAIQRGVGLIFFSFKKSDPWTPQFRMSRILRPYIEQLQEKFHFTFLEKNKKTWELREASMLGSLDNESTELVLIEEPHMVLGGVVDNFYHGSPKKYRLTNVTEESAAAFFADYHAGKLSTFWASRERPQKSTDGELVRLTSETFAQVAYESPKEVGIIVLFYNGRQRDGCESCQEVLTDWERVARRSRRMKEFQNVIVAAIDQSDNEHPEDMIAQRLGEPLAVWYGPGTPRQRKGRRQKLERLSVEFRSGASDREELVMTKLRDFLEDQEGDEEEL